ncbi:serine/threonine-protein kinase [Streptomyces sp. NBC_00354]|uniref:serine/threonine-protein kinase n=1 Tax=Streptomyces sp. NBC_00354 TaxID=2975723 RepID=UPI003FA6B4F1
MVAVKAVRAELAAAPDFRRRFAKEAAVARQVGGEWTAAVLAADPDAALPWVAAAYVAGPTLQQVVVEQHGPRPEYSVRGLASGLCRALDDIHAAGLVHRDLKPSNVMVTIEGPKVIDFGIARALDSTTGGLTSAGVVVGSPGFMSPEQIRGESLTEASNIFSLGAVLAFAASGRLPLGRPNDSWRRCRRPIGRRAIVGLRQLPDGRRYNVKGPACRNGKNCEVLAASTRCG